MTRGGFKQTQINSMNIEQSVHVFYNHIHFYEVYDARNGFMGHAWEITPYNKMMDVITYPCPKYLQLSPKSSYIQRTTLLWCQADVSIFYTSNLYWWGKGWPVDGLPFPDTGCPVPDVSIYYMSNINELPDGILFHWFCKCTPPWMFLPLDIPSEYRPEHVTFGLLCVIFKFPSRIFCRRVPGFEDSIAAEIYRELKFGLLIFGTTIGYFPGTLLLTWPFLNFNGAAVVTIFPYAKFVYKFSWNLQDWPSIVQETIGNSFRIFQTTI